MPARTPKIASLQAAADRITHGSTVAVGGLSYFGAPMSLVREVVRRRIRELTLITSAVTSIQADLLIAAGCVRKIISPYVAFEELGLAPNFRRAIEQNKIEIVEIGEAFLGFGLKAAASGAPFYALPPAIAASGCARVNSLYKLSRDPFSGDEIVCVPALRVDCALLHAQRGDCFGNLQYASACYMDPLLARAADRVIATVDELAEDGFEIRPAVHGFQVDALVPLYGSARPTASFGHYDVDRQEIARYLKASRTPEGLCSYFGDLADERRYLETMGAPPALATAVEANLAADVPCSKGELMAVVISRAVRDGMFTGAGTGCWEVAAGLRLAQLTHAPNLTFTWGGSGAVNARLPFLPPSLNGDEALAECEGAISLEDMFDLELRGRFDVMFASAMQVDQYGNLNLAGIGPHDRPKLRGPGTVGLEFAPFAGELVIFLRSHSRQTLVERVDFISGIGYGTGPGSRARWGIDDSRGPVLVVSNLAVMDFEAASKRVRLKSVHPGVSVQQVKEQTGFELVIPDEVPETPPPSDEELRLLRTRIDRGGLLARTIT